jgi:hypothetical protein
MPLTTEELLQVMDLLRLEIQVYRNAGKPVDPVTVSALRKCNDMLAVAP